MRTDNLSAGDDVVFRVCMLVYDAVCVCVYSSVEGSVGQGVPLVLIANEGVDAEDGPLVETFAQGDSEIGADGEIACLVLCGVAWKVGV